MVIRFGVWSGILWIVFSVCVAPVKPKTWTFSEFVLVCGHCVFWRCHGGIFGKCQHGDKPTQAAEHNGIHWHGVYGNHCENLLQVRITSKNNMILETAIKIPKIRFYILRVISKRYAIGGFPGINLKPPKAGRTLWGRRCKRWNVEETWHDIEVAASFGNFIPEIWFSELRNLIQWYSVNFTWFHVEKSITSRQQLQVCIAGMSHLTFLLSVVPVVESSRGDFFAGLVKLIMADGCKWIFDIFKWFLSWMVIYLNMWFDLNVCHGWSATSQSRWDMVRLIIFLIGGDKNTCLN